MRQCNMLKNWGLCFLNRHGNLNRTIVADAFGSFLEQKSRNRLRVPGQCVLKGFIYKGNEIMHDDKIYTKEIRFIDRVDTELTKKLQDEIKVPAPNHKLYRATTISGSEFFFYLDEHADELYQMVEQF